MTAKLATGAPDAASGAIALGPAENELSPVRGPSAFGGTPRRFLDLLWLSSAIEFRARYATTFLGYLWTIVRPLIFFGLIFLVMRQILGFGKNIPNYGLMLIINLVLFQYFQEATARALRSVTSKEGLVRKMQFPRIVIPLSVSLTAGSTVEAVRAETGDLRLDLLLHVGLVRKHRVGAAAGDEHLLAMNDHELAVRSRELLRKRQRPVGRSRSIGGPNDRLEHDSSFHAESRRTTAAPHRGGSASA